VRPERHGLRGFEAIERYSVVIVVVPYLGVESGLGFNKAIETYFCSLLDKIG